MIDASKLGKRLSSEIWNSFGAIQVEDNFTYPSIDTKTVADGSSTLKICQFFVACSKCFSVFKYDGHAYGTTGLVKHVKICQGTNQRVATNQGYTPNSTIDHTTIDTTHTSSVPNNTSTTTTTTTINGPVVCGTTRRKREPTTPRSRANAAATAAANTTTNSNQPSLRYLVKIVEELRSDMVELKQKTNEMINLISGTGYVGQIQIISNEGEKVEDDLQKSD